MVTGRVNGVRVRRDEGLSLYECAINDSHETILVRTSIALDHEKRGQEVVVKTKFFDDARNIMIERLTLSLDVNCSYSPWISHSSYATVIVVKTRP